MKVINELFWIDAELHLCVIEHSAKVGCSVSEAGQKLFDLGVPLLDSVDLRSLFIDTNQTECELYSFDVDTHDSHYLRRKALNYRCTSHQIVQAVIRLGLKLFKPTRHYPNFRTVDEAMANAARMEEELPFLIQPEQTTYDMITLRDEIVRLREANLELQSRIE